MAEMLRAWLQLSARRINPGPLSAQSHSQGCSWGLEPLRVQVMAEELVLEQVKCCCDRLCLLPPAGFPTHFLLFLSSVQASAVCSAAGML